MKERPILFSAPMVRAILEGRKTMTRRIAIPRHDDKKPCEHWSGSGEDSEAVMCRHCEHGSEGRGCPYGVPGDRLWVKETFCEFEHKPVFRADSLNRYGTEDADSARCRLDYGCKWKPSIFMPRALSRITLEVTRVRVERVQEISDEDAKAEGVSMDVSEDEIDGSPDEFADWAVNKYLALWESINGKGSWNANPWVWVVSFKRI